MKEQSTTLVLLVSRQLHAVGSASLSQDFCAKVKSVFIADGRG